MLMLLSVRGSCLFSGEDDDSVMLASPEPLAVIGVISGIGLAAVMAVIGVTSGGGLTTAMGVTSGAGLTAAMGVTSGALRRIGGSGSGVGDSDRSLGIIFAICVNGAVVRAFSAAASISGPCVSNPGEGRGVE